MRADPEGRAPTGTRAVHYSEPRLFGAVKQKVLPVELLQQKNPNCGRGETKIKRPVYTYQPRRGVGAFIYTRGVWATRTMMIIVIIIKKNLNERWTVHSWISTLCTLNSELTIRIWYTCSNNGEWRKNGVARKKVFPFCRPMSCGKSKSDFPNICIGVLRRGKCDGGGRNMTGLPLAEIDLPPSKGKRPRVPRETWETVYFVLCFRRIRCDGNVVKHRPRRGVRAATRRRDDSFRKLKFRKNTAPRRFWV